MVRVVYDGPGRAGKTTNLERLCGFFTTMRRGELFTPATTGQGRTLHFDWLDLEGGLIGGHRVRCQLVTVPGQHVLRSRRAHLIEGADVIVFVCEATRSGVATAKPMLDQIRSLRTNDRPLPIVVQANKQDIDGVLDEDALREGLGLSPEIAVVASVAEEGIGVRETAVVAVRAAAELLQRHVAVHGVESLAGSAETEHELFEQMQAIGLDFEVPEPEGIKGRKTQDVAAESPPESGVDVTVTSEAETDAEQASDEASPSVTPEAEAPAAPSGTDGERATVSAEADHATASAEAERETSPGGPPEQARRTSEPGPEPGVPRSWTRPAPAAPPVPEGTLAERFSDYDPTRPTPVPKVRRNTSPYRGGRTPRTRLPDVRGPSAVIPDPPLPRGDVASLQIWPPAYGRPVLQQLRLSEAVLRDDLQSQRGKADGSGSDTVVYRVDDWALKTRRSRRYPDIDAARVALVELARRKVALRGLQPPKTVLSLQSDPTDVYWLWTVAPWTPSLRSRMGRAEEEGDSEALGDALCRFAEAAMNALHLAAHEEVVLDIHPSNFAQGEAGISYIDDDILFGSRLPAAGYALVRRVEEYADAESAVARYVDRIHELIEERLNAEIVAKLDLEALVRDVPLRDDRAEAAKRRLADALRSLR